MFNPFDHYTIPLEGWLNDFIFWLTDNFRNFFLAIKTPVALVMEWIETFLLWLNPVVFLVLLLFIAWRIAGWRVAVFSVVGAIFLGFLDLWEVTMTTLSMIICAVAFCAAVGIPLGIIASRSNKFEAGLRPVLDVMQSIPSFAYLAPVALLFGIGDVPGIMATIVFALPPIIRLTNLGIRQVQRELVEAAYAFGATPRQVLWDIQIPLATRTIMAGLNQTLMLSLSMVVIAAIIGAGGLGDEVRTGLNNLQPGQALAGGIGIVVLAIILDRITQALAKTDESGSRRSLAGWLANLFTSARRGPLETATAGGGGAGTPVSPSREETTV
ncbi:MAG: ABC transporter permease [Dehalococcoidia bacterium]